MYEKITELIKDGGPVMWLILFCSLMAFFIIIERLLYLHRAKINVSEWLHGLKNVLKRNNVVEAITICDETPGPVASMVRAAILHCDRDEAKIRHAIEEASYNEIPLLERNLRGLANIAQISTLLGLLGTVVGMIGAFMAIDAQGSFISTSELAQNIWQALLTTAAGLCVAIPAYAFYHFLAGRVQNLLHDMEKAGSEITYFLTTNSIRLDAGFVEPDTLAEAETEDGDE